MPSTRSEKKKANDKNLELIEAQNDILETIQELLDDLLGSTETLKRLYEFLQLNKSRIPYSRKAIYERVADFIFFGAIPKCQKCNSGDMIFTGHGYKCDGELNEWSGCGNREKYPRRIVANFPDSMAYFRSELVTMAIDVNVHDRLVPPDVEVMPVDRSIQLDLPRPIRNLMKLVFDGNEMKQKIKDFEAGRIAVPFGKLSIQQLQEAHQILSRIHSLITSGADYWAIHNESQNFHKLVPQATKSIQIKSSVIISTEMIKEKRKMLELLLQFEKIHSLLRQSEANGNVDLFESYCYEHIKTKLEPLSKDSEDFKMIEKYVKNTQTPKYCGYTLTVAEAFRIDREGEKARYRQFKSLPYRQLLWHGSTVPNFASILKNGLKIAPLDATKNGDMFGKGIYFADMVSKSALYCRITSSQPGLLILAEVALGNTKDTAIREYISNLDGHYNSVRVLGNTYPHPAQTITTEDGVEIALGTPVSNKKMDSQLHCNEYIVYDEARVNMKFLVKLNFVFTGTAMQ